MYPFCSLKSHDAQEASARHDAECIAQQAEARLERQAIVDQSAAAERRNPVELEAENPTLSSTAQATAEARAKAKSAPIQGQLQVNLPCQEAEPTRIRAEVELAPQQALRNLEREKAQPRAEITSTEFARSKKPHPQGCYF